MAKTIQSDITVLLDGVIVDFISVKIEDDPTLVNMPSYVVKKRKVLELKNGDVIHDNTGRIEIIITY